MLKTEGSGSLQQCMCNKGEGLVCNSATKGRVWLQQRGGSGCNKGEGLVATVQQRGGYQVWLGLHVLDILRNSDTVTYQLDRRGV